MTSKTPYAKLQTDQDFSMHSFQALITDLAACATGVSVDFDRVLMCFPAPLAINSCCDTFSFPNCESKDTAASPVQTKMDLLTGPRIRKMRLNSACADVVTGNTVLGS